METTATAQSASAAAAIKRTTGAQVTFSVTSFPRHLDFVIKQERSRGFGGGAFGNFDDRYDDNDNDMGHNSGFCGSTFGYGSSAGSDVNSLMRQDSAQEEFNQSYSNMLVHHAAILLGQVLTAGNLSELLRLEFVIKINALNEAVTIVATISGCDLGHMQNLSVSSELLKLTEVNIVNPELDFVATKDIVTEYAYDGCGNRTKQSTVLAASRLSAFIAGEEEEFVKDYKLCVSKLVDSEDIGSIRSSMFPGNDRNNISFQNRSPLQRCGNLEFFQNTKAARNSFEVVSYIEKQKKAIAMLKFALTNAALSGDIKKNNKSRKAWVEGLTEGQANQINTMLQKSFPLVNFKCKKNTGVEADGEVFGIAINYGELRCRSMEQFVNPPVEESAATARLGSLGRR